MVPSEMMRRVGAVVLAWLVFANAAYAAELPKVVVIPFSQGQGAPERAGARFATLVAEELKTREDDLVVVAGPAPKGPVTSSGAAGEAPAPAKPSREALAALADGKKDLAELQFDGAVFSLKKGIELSLKDPSSADFAAVNEAYVSLAVAYFRQGEEKSAQAALFTVARLDPAFKLAEGKFPPVFLREFDKAKKRAEKATRGSISIDGPPGSTAFVDGRDLGMVPVVEENLPVGVHYVKVEGARGERYGHQVDLKGGVAKVKAAFAGAAAAAVAAGPAEPKISTVLDGETASRVAQYARAAGADFALVGIVYRSSEHQVTAATALYSARRQGFGALPVFAADHELLTANVEAFKLADEVIKKADAFGAPIGLPHTLTAQKAVRLAAADTPKAIDPELSVATGPRVAIQPASPDGQIRALANPSTFEGDGAKPPDDPPGGGTEVKPGMPAWVWVVVGVGAAAAAGGAYYGISESSRPVTGKLTATW